MSNKFTVIRGGLTDSMNTSRREIEEAYITNTRLMGVLSLYLHYRLPENGAMSDIHQFFYFDIEEFGFEDYKVVKDGNLEMVSAIEASMMGGLGGDNIPVSEREAAYLLQKYAAYNRAHRLPLPDGREDYDFLLNMDADLTEEEIAALHKKECVELDSEYEAVNYFLMRCTGKDFEGASLLSKPGLPLDLYPELRAGCFCKNTIRHGDAPNKFISDSLVEFDGIYHLVVSEVTVEGLSVTDYQRISAFRISASEAALMLARPEYVTVYQIPEGSQPFSRTSTDLTKRAAVANYDAGTLYMIYHQNNKHVNKKEYRLNEDVLGTYFVISGKQLVATAYSLEEIRYLEYNLRVSEIGENMKVTARYEFIEPVIFDFMQCGLDDFDEFVNLIRIPPDEK